MVRKAGYRLISVAVAVFILAGCTGSGSSGTTFSANDPATSSSSGGGTTGGTTGGGTTGGGTTGGGTTGGGTTGGGTTGGGTTVVTGSATISWTAPTARIDGTSASIAEIAGYRIHYGTSRTALNQVAAVPNAYVFNQTIGNLALGTYYFAVTAYDTQGVESGYSNIVTRTVQ